MNLFFAKINKQEINSFDLFECFNFLSHMSIPRLFFYNISFFCIAFEQTFLRIFVNKSAKYSFTIPMV